MSRVTFSRRGAGPEERAGPRGASRSSLQADDVTAGLGSDRPLAATPPLFLFCHKEEPRGCCSIPDGPTRLETASHLEGSRPLVRAFACSEDKRRSADDATFI